MNEVDYMDEEIDLGKMFKYIWKKIWIVVLGAVIGVAVGCAFYFVTAKTTYTSGAVFYALNKNSSVKTAEVSNLAENSIAILKQAPTLQAVIDQNGLSYTSSALQGMIDTTTETSTQVFTVNVTASDPYEAKKIVDGIVLVLPQKVSNITEGLALQVVDAGTLNTTPNKSSWKKYLLIGFAGGLFLAVVLVGLMYIMGKKVHDDDFVNKLPVRLPILNSLPNLNRKHGGGMDKKAIFGADLNQEEAEAYHLLRKNMIYALGDCEDRPVFGITSAMHDEGKSVTAFNLAYAFAESGKKVLLVDGDLRTPVLSNRLNLKPTPGFANVLDDLTVLHEAVQASGIHQNCFVLTAGNLPSNPTALLESKNLKDVMMTLRKDFDVIIVDLSPVNDGTDALTISSALDGLVLAVREEYSRIPDLTEAVQKLKFAKVNGLGFAYIMTASSKKSGK